MPVLCGVRMTEEQRKTVNTECFGGPEGDGATEPDLDSTVVASMRRAGCNLLHFTEREDSSLIARVEAPWVVCTDGSWVEFKNGEAINHGRPEKRAEAK